ncbi:MAG: hypothetical protein ACN2B6_11895 [Rickettsiales bacterium]
MKYKINGNFQIRHDGKRYDFKSGETIDVTEKGLIEKLDKVKQAVKQQTASKKAE